MKRRIHAKRLTVGAFALLTLTSLILLAGYSGLVFATQPPPPQEYSVTVNKNGGDDDCCQVRIVSPGGTAWSSTSVQGGPYVAGTTITVDAKTECPCGYYFDEWECEDDSELDGDPHHLGYFNINTNTEATAVFKPRTASLTIYVDDPTPGSSSPHSVGGSVGHAFWRFEGSCVSTELEAFVNETWGFYPSGSAYSTGSSGWKTWLSPPGHLNNDSGHDYTASRTYQISHDELSAGLEYTKSIYDATRANPPTVNYNAETSNCTDAAISAASAAGVTLPDAHGECDHWTHSFSGNCPGTLGETLND